MSKVLTDEELAIKQAVRVLTEHGIKAELSVTWCSGERLVTIMIMNTNLPNLLMDCTPKELRA